MTECQICLTEFPDSQLIACMGCDVKTCQECTKNYLLELTTDAKCSNPSCGCGWDIKFLSSHFQSSWLNGNKPGQYRHSRKKVMVEQQKALFPETLIMIEQRKHQERIDFLTNYREFLEQVTREKIANKNKNIAFINRLENLGVPIPEGVERNFNKDEFYEKHRQRNEEKVRVLCKVMDVEYEETLGLSKSIRRNYQFVCPCPKEDCRGLINNRNMKCTVCDLLVCGKCRTIIYDKNKHVCDPETVQTISLLKEDCKPCPKCAIQIYRIEGCDQMWCTQCKITFSWKTGTITHGRIHNPHALRWYHEQGDLPRDIHDIPCGDFPRVLRRNIYYEEQSKWSDKIFQVHYFSVLEAFLSLTDRIEKIDAYINDNTMPKLRENYLMGRITDSQFEKQIFRYNRVAERKRKELDICMTVRHLAVERFVAYDQYNIGTEKFYRDLYRLTKFFNETIESEMEYLSKRSLQFYIKYNHNGHRCLVLKTRQLGQRLTY